MPAVRQKLHLSHCADFRSRLCAEFKKQGGMILENTENAIDKADSLASELCIVRPELCSTGCAVRVTDGDSNEFYRTPVDPIPAWLKSSRRAR